jgi:CheY-like chemotaxis protein
MQPNKSEQRPGENVQADRAAAKPRALVAEDDAQMRDLVAALLRSAGYEVSEAQNGVDLLDEIIGKSRPHGAEPFQVIVADINMPGINGLEVLAALPRALSRIPVILITAYGSAAKRAEAYRHGAFAVLDKPFAVGDLCALLRWLRSSERSAAPPLH